MTSVDPPAPWQSLRSSATPPVTPAYYHAEITSIAAATVIFDLITLLSLRS